MPIYEYRRKTDGGVIEVFQKASEEPLTKCPETGDPVEKIVSRTAFQLKGSGWYTTDYKSPPASKDAEKAPAKEAKETGATKEGSETTAASPPPASKESS